MRRLFTAALAAALALFSVLCPRTASATDSGSAVVTRNTPLLEQQNQLIDRYRLERIPALKRLKRLIAAGRLVKVSATAAYYPDFQHVGSQDSANSALYAHARPWVRDFLNVVLKPISQETGERFKVTSLVRTMDYQRRLRRVSLVAASGINHWRLSPHLTGSTVDISTKDMSDSAKQALSHSLSALSRAGAVVFMEEFFGGCFHIFVLPDWRKRAAKAGR